MRLTLYSRTDCHLCEEMLAVVRTVGPEFGAVLEEIDVDGDATLAARYGLDVPVLLVNGRMAFAHRVTPRALRERLAQERG
ncbi:MAG: glutaredoxin family protein [bacterium]|nr:glutaredoxin family protein [bacterium]